MTLSVDVPGAPIEMAADEAKLLRVLENLVGNAIRYCKTGNSIRISLVETDGDHVRFQVADNGPGIPEHLRESLFEPYARNLDANETTGGTGLGLTICKQFVEAHGGRIWIEEADGGGACFTFEVSRIAHQEGGGGQSSQPKVEAQTIG